MNLKGVDKKTAVRMIVLAIILANQIATTFFNFQLVPFTDDQLYTGVSTGFTLAGSVWAAWKNNSFTRPAQQADRQLANLKKGLGK